MKTLVFVETDNGMAVGSSWEALGKALSLGGEVEAVVIGQNVAGVAAEAGSRGAVRVYVIDDASRALFDLDLFTADVKAVLAQSGAEAFLVSHTGNGRDLATAVGFDLNAGMIADCLELKAEGGKLVGVRPIYSGNILADVTVDGKPQIATLRPRAAAPAPATGAAAEVVAVAPAAGSARVQVKAVERAETGEVSLTDASIIVSGGRGVAKDPAQGFKLIGDLAAVLGGAVGASRAAVDAGFIPYKHQVGQTGKVVRPDVYIACGISGAVQHLAGMGSSKVIVAINKDSESPMFSVANYGIVGDLFEVVPAITQAAKTKLNK
ncbi:MAG: electron transfer flavoprotein subunit alpha/FixB family protein [Caldilineales bacterium]|nr:electron transfer flavoprotein subunit alpha/FixB family protein [Caldilineales bacterium]MCW5857196.1 electron transfer flavoprotein subunit alpha/FixB family protein [Caldilineales bacterium]